MVRKSTLEEIESFELEQFYLEDTKICRERGYHRVQKEPEKGSPTFCYDCSYPVWHPENNIGELPYRVEPL